MHVFVSHIGFFLKEYKEIESFANYDIETKNADNKAFVQRGSNRFGGATDRSGIAVQQLQREFRIQELDVFIQPTDKSLEVTNNKRKAETPSPENPNAKRRKKPQPRPQIGHRPKLEKLIQYHLLGQNLLPATKNC